MAATHVRKAIFTPEEKALIRPFKVAYLEATSPTARKDIAIATILPSLITKWEAEMAPGATLDTEQACKNILQWIRNNWRLGDSPTKAKLVVKRTDVVWMLHRPLVFEEIGKLMEMTPEEAEKGDWFKHRMRAIAVVINNMSDAERAALDEQKKFMSENGFPEDERPKRAAKFAHKRMDTAARAHYLEMGLLSVSLISSAVVNSGALRTGVWIHDNVAELVGVDFPSFEATNKKLLTDVKRAFTDYVSKVKAAAHKAEEDPANIVFLRFDEEGFPILRGFKTGKNLAKQQLEHLWRAYLRRHYYLASGGKGEGEKSSPYERICRRQSRYIDPKYLPPGIKLSDPRNMKQAELSAIMTHISERQLTNEPRHVFRFSRVSRTRKTSDHETFVTAKYPGEAVQSSEEDTPVKPKRPKKGRKSRAMKAVTRPKKAATQKAIEGRLDTTVPAAITGRSDEAVPVAESVLGEDNVPQAFESPVAAIAENTYGTSGGHDLQDNSAGSDLGVSTVPHEPAPFPMVNYGGIPTFGPNDAVQYPWPMPMPAPTQYEHPLTPGWPGMSEAARLGMLFPAGMPQNELAGIDPSLIGLRAAPLQLPTPRASVTAHLSPTKLRSDTSSIADLPPATVLNSEYTGPQIGKGKTRIAAPDIEQVPAAQPVPATQTAPATHTRPRPTATSSKPAKDCKAIDDQEQSRGAVIEQDDIDVVNGKSEKVKPPRPRPKGKAAMDLAGQGPVQSNATPAASVRMTADVLAAAEANKLVLPAKRVRTARIRTD